MSLHPDPEYDAQLSRTLIAAHAEAADLGQAIAIASRVAPGDNDGWFTEWSAAAGREVAAAEDAEAKGHPVSARQAFLRASEYARQAVFFTRRDLDDERLQSGYRLHRDAFRRAVPHLAHEVVAAEIAHPAGGRMGAYLVLAPGEGPRGLVLAPCGYDSTAEAGWVATGYMAARRGHHVLLWDGPGQGGMLYEQRIPMAPDFETTTRAVVDWAAARPEVDPDRIVMVGRSFAGYLAPRGAAGEPRIRALVCDPGQYDFVSRLVPGLIDQATWARVLAADPETDAALEAMRAAPAKAEYFGARMATMGAGTVGEFLRMQPAYSLEGHAERIACPTLLCEGEGDFAAQTDALAARLTCPHEVVRFRAAEGAGGHCEGLGAARFEGRVFDWLERVALTPR